MKSTEINTPEVTELLYDALETEKGGVQIYTTALRCAINDDLREEWSKYLEQTKEHVQIVSGVLLSLDLPLETETPGRKIVRHIGVSLVKAMEMALRGPSLSAAQRVAAECVTLAETKDHMNWGLIGELAKNSNADLSALLKEAHGQVEPEEDEQIVAPRLGVVTRANGRELKAEFTFLTAASVLFDAVFIAPGDASVEDLNSEPEAREFVQEAYKHCKIIGAAGAAVDYLNAALVEKFGETDKSDGLVFLSPEVRNDGAGTFIRELSKHRHWERERVTYPL